MFVTKSQNKIRRIKPVKMLKHKLLRTSGKCEHLTHKIIGDVISILSKKF